MQGGYSIADRTLAWRQGIHCARLQVQRSLLFLRRRDCGYAPDSISALAEPWRTVTLFNPVVYLVSGFRWTFFGVADVPLWSSVAVMVGIIAACLAAIAWVFKTGYRLKQ